MTGAKIAKEETHHKFTEKNKRGEDSEFGIHKSQMSVSSFSSPLFSRSSLSFSKWFVMALNLFFFISRPLIVSRYCELTSPQTDISHRSWVIFRIFQSFSLFFDPFVLLLTSTDPNLKMRQRVSNTTHQMKGCLSWMMIHLKLMALITAQNEITPSGVGVMIVCIIRGKNPMQSLLMMMFTLYFFTYNNLQLVKFLFTLQHDYVRFYSKKNERIEICSSWPLLKNCCEEEKNRVKYRGA